MPAAARPAQAHSHSRAGGQVSTKPKLYNPRHPEQTLLYPTVAEHFETLFVLASSGQLDGQGDHRTQRPTRVRLRKYLECGIFAHGFARARCDDCGHDYFVAFSCKGRGVCPSCNNRRMVETAAHLGDHVFPRLPVRQRVVSVPKRLRWLQPERAAPTRPARLLWAGACWRAVTPKTCWLTRRMTHDYKRNGVTTLFAALNVLTGKVLSMTDRLHRHQEWLRFLKTIDRNTPKTKQLHLIVDNYATRKHPQVIAWLVKHPRFHVHFTPTSSSWLNMVERFFRDITDKRIRRGVFASVPDLEAAINEYIAVHNAKPKPFIWTAKASDIRAKVTRAGPP